MGASCPRSYHRNHIHWPLDLLCSQEATHAIHASQTGSNRSAHRGTGSTRMVHGEIRIRQCLDGYSRRRSTSIAVPASIPSRTCFRVVYRNVWDRTLRPQGLEIRTWGQLEWEKQVAQGDEHNTVQGLQCTSMGISSPCLRDGYIR